MKRLAILFALLPSLAHAEVNLLLPTANERKAADIASWATVATALALDAASCGKDAHCYVMMGLRDGAVFGSTQLVKTLVHRARPCAPDCGIDSQNSSFYSMHTAFAFSTRGGPRLAFVVPLAVGTGAGRVMSKHWLSDAIVGAVVGLGGSYIR